MKSTKGERLTDTIHFNRKHITNPTITHTDKVVEAIAECVKVVQGVTNTDATLEIKDLKQHVELTKQAVASSPTSTNAEAPNDGQHLPRVPSLPRVPMTISNELHWLT